MRAQAERVEEAPATRRPAPAPALQLVRGGNAAVSALLARQEAVLDPPAEAVATRPQVRQGSRGPAVSDVQTRLNTADPAAAPQLVSDGIFGKLTRGAVVAFQQAAGLVPDGIVGPLTHAALDERQGGQPGTTPPPTPTTGALTPEQEAEALQFNSVYDQQSVRMIQARTGPAVTGIMDAPTVQSVSVFQQSRSVPAHGRVDDDTLTAIIGDLVPAQMHDHAIHLVTDFNEFDLTPDTLSVHLDGALAPALSAVRFESGGVRVVTLAPGAFASATTLRDEIGTQMSALVPVPGETGPAPALLDPTDAQVVAVLNANKFGDPRSVRIIQGLVGAAPDGLWSGELVQRIALFQQLSTLPGNGLIEETHTLPEMTARLLATGQNDAVLRLIVDFFDFREDGNLVSIYFDPSLGSGPGTNHAQVARIPGQGSSIQVGPDGMNQPFAGIVHTVAHEMLHIRQLTNGPESSATREFLAHSIGVLSEGIPEQAIEGHSQTEGNPHPPFGFANSARRTLGEWNDMPAEDQRQNRERFVRCHDKVFERIRPGSTDAAIHAVLLQRWTDAFNRLPPA